MVAASKPHEESSDDFEQVAESREIVEERLLKTKLVIVNLTLQ